MSPRDLAALACVIFVMAVGCRARPAEVQGEPPAEAPGAPPQPSAAEQTLPPATESGFESILLAEEPDPGWASAREATLHQAFKSSGSPKLLSVVCKTTLCKLVIESADAEPPMNLPRPAVADCAIAFYRRADASVVFVSRRGHGLPTAPGIAAKSKRTANGVPFND